MTIHTKQANASNYKAASRTAADIGYLVIHYTGNRGDTARNNADYFARQSGLSASAHYFVDEHEVWQSVRDKDVAWHVGARSYAHPTCRNANSIGVEICMLDKAGNVRQGSIDHAAQLVRELMTRYSITIGRVLRHYDVTRKDCPAPMVEAAKLWTTFKAALTAPEHVEEDEDMTQEQFAKMYDQINPMYRNLDDVPEYWRAEAKALMDCGAIKGDSHTPLAIRQEELQAAIIARRAIRANYTASTHDPGAYR